MYPFPPNSNPTADLLGVPAKFAFWVQRSAPASYSQQSKLNGFELCPQHTYAFVPMVKQEAASRDKPEPVAPPMLVTAVHVSLAGI